MGWLVGWLVGIGVIIEHEAGSVASAKGVGTGSTIKRTQKKRGEKQRISWKALSTVFFFFFFFCAKGPYLRLFLAISPLVSATCSCRNWFKSPRQCE